MIITSDKSKRPPGHLDLTLHRHLVALDKIRVRAGARQISATFRVCGLRLCVDCHVVDGRMFTFCCN